MEYTMNGKISLDDYIQFNKVHRKQGFTKIRRIIFFSIAFIFGIYLGFDLDIRNIGITIGKIKELTFGYIILIISMVIIFFAFIVLLLFLFKRIVLHFIYKKYYYSDKILQQVQNYKINEINILITTESISSNYSKDNIQKIIFDKDSIYIYLGLNRAEIIKKRFLENEIEFEELVNFIKLNYCK
jgi:hypothetical protein